MAPEVSLPDIVDAKTGGNRGQLQPGQCLSQVDFPDGVNFLVPIKGLVSRVATFLSADGGQSFSLANEQQAPPFVAFPTPRRLPVGSYVLRAVAQYAVDQENGANNDVPFVVSEGITISNLCSFLFPSWLLVLIST